MFDRVSSDTLNYGGHTECPVSALRSGRGRQFGRLFAAPPPSASFVQDPKAI
jgi:hypothetical protein